MYFTIAELNRIRVQLIFLFLTEIKKIKVNKNLQKATVKGQTLITFFIKIISKYKFGKIIIIT